MNNQCPITMHLVRVIRSTRSFPPCMIQHLLRVSHPVSPICTLSTTMCLYGPDHIASGCIVTTIRFNFMRSITIVMPLIRPTPCLAQQQKRFTYYARRHKPLSLSHFPPRWFLPIAALLLRCSSVQRQEWNTIYREWDWIIQPREGASMSVAREKDWEKRFMRVELYFLKHHRA